MILVVTQKELPLAVEVSIPDMILVNTAAKSIDDAIRKRVTPT